MHQLRIGMAQINTTMGDFPGNKGKILKTIEDARALGIDLLTFPELAICGYPPEDLLFKPQFISENLKVLNDIVRNSTGLTVVVGFVDAKGNDIYNAAAIIYHGKLAAVYHKVCLPNYGVFDEQRYFKAGSTYPIYLINGLSLGVTICEDIWVEEGPVTCQAHAGAELIVNISASPYHFGKGKSREEMLKNSAIKNSVFMEYCNLVGGQDELVFDGNSLVCDDEGRILGKGKQFEEELVVLDIDHDAIANLRPGRPLSQKMISEKPPDSPKPLIPARKVAELGPEAEVYAALVLGTRDYIIKNGFEKVLIGLSGGIDSSLVAAIAVDALGASNVIGVAMPSPYSSPGSISDAKALANNLGIKLLTIPIDKIFQSYIETLTDGFKNTKPDITEENIQARIRGNILMALSNKFGWLVLTTGNKSEMATGYATLYGDMAGGFAVIKDVPKTMVYKLAEHRNSMAGDSLIPTTIIDKEPSAELRPEQKDADTLPRYDQLDPILTAYVEEDKSIEQIISLGFEQATVEKTAKLVDRSEYKRRQAPPGIKITPRAFGRDRRLPITNQFKER